LLLEIKHPAPTDPDRLLSPKETSQMFDVDLSTLYRWDKLGYLTKIKIGGKVRYRMSDIQKLMKHE
jgi:predicted site-specific integrase-resolvase